MEELEIVLASLVKLGNADFGCLASRHFAHFHVLRQFGIDGTWFDRTYDNTVSAESVPHRLEVRVQECLRGIVNGLQLPTSISCHTSNSNQ